jgi:hypothetical protein
MYPTCTCPGFLANGAALSLRVDPHPKLWTRRYPGATTVLPPSSTQTDLSIDAEGWGAMASQLNGTAAAPLKPLRVDRYPFIPPMTLRLGLMKQVHGVHNHRAAGKLNATAQSRGWPSDGFPPPHVLPNASWHMGTFMSAEHVIDKLRSAAHTECNRLPFNSLHWQRTAQRKCLHFCNTSGARTIGRPISELPAAAYPPAICKREYAKRWRVEPWCAVHARRYES